MDFNNLKEFTYLQIQKHNTKDDCWVIISDFVYDLTLLKRYHPVGEFPIDFFAGKDATWIFNSVYFHKGQVLKMLEQQKIGKLKRGENEKIPNNGGICSVFALMLIIIVYIFIII